VEESGVFGVFEEPRVKSVHLSCGKRAAVSVGASIARPPKFKEFRIFRRDLLGFRLAATDFAEQNLRTSDARPYDLSGK
jgi:hypothetical protein